MTTINYTYKIMEVTPQGMVIEYSSDGLPSIPVGVPVPRQGEYDSVEQAVDALQKLYAPIEYWKNILYPVMEIPLNLSGTSSASILPAEDNIDPTPMVQPSNLKSLEADKL